MEEASYLSKLCEKVFVIHRRDEFRASKIMQERVLQNPNIEILWNTTVKEFLGEEKNGRHKLNGTRLQNTKTGQQQDLNVDAVFLAIGHIPNTSLFKDHVDLDPEGYIIVDERQRTNREGLYAAGDAHDRHYRQAITAAGYGCKAAMEVERYLTEKGFA